MSALDDIAQALGRIADQREPIRPNWDEQRTRFAQTRRDIEALGARIIPAKVVDQVAEVDGERVQDLGVLQDRHGEQADGSLVHLVLRLKGGVPDGVELLHPGDALELDLADKVVEGRKVHEESSSRCVGEATPTERSVEVAADSAAGSAGGPLASGRPAATVGGAA
jgi:hypothetical protein